MSEKYKIAKEFGWEMSHRLCFHDGLCRNIHGHSYKIRIELTGVLNESAMVLDYYDIKKIITPILEKLDHAFLCDSKDKLMIDFLTMNGFKLVIMNDYTTAENITKYILDDIITEFAKYDNIYEVKIRVYETEDSFAEQTKVLRSCEL